MLSAEGNPSFAVSGGVAVWAHVGGFVAGVILIKLFANPRLVQEHKVMQGRRWSGITGLNRGSEG